MKKWNKMLEFVDAYVYDSEQERIEIDTSVICFTRAKKWYDKFIEENKIKLGSLEHWYLDIALDFLRILKKEDAETFIRIDKCEFSNWHFGSGLYVRNRYVHCAKKHFYLMADDVSGEVLDMILTITSPLYDYFNKDLCKIFGHSDFYDIKKYYYKKYPFIEDIIVRYVDGELKLTPDEIVNKIKSELRVRLGRDCFQRQVVIAVNTIGKRNIFPDNRIKFIDEVYKVHIPFEKEYRWMDTLWKDGYLQRLAEDNTSGVCVNMQECTGYLQTKLELDYEDAIFLAETLWSAFKKQ